jgi:hypothetical protein
MVYVLFRPNLGVASLVVQVWDAEAVEPWLAPYARTLWHLPHPGGDLTDCRVGDLVLRCTEPLTAYRLSYHDGESLSLDLDYRALGAPYEVPVPGGNGHFDQACQVTGELVINGSTLAVDAPAVRDRSWYVRDDHRTLRAGYTYGVVDGTEHFVAHSRGAPNGADETAIVGGYLERDGRRAPLANGTRRVLSRRRGHPDRIELAATDADGRDLVAIGRVDASLASQSTPGMFSWMSVVGWSLADRPALGEDHDVWSPDLLGAARVRPG